MKGVHQLIDGEHAVFFCNIGDMGITGGGVRVGVTKQGLDMTKAQAAFKEMSGKTVPKGVDGDFFLMPQSATTVFMAFCVPPLSM